MGTLDAFEVLDVDATRRVIDLGLGWRRGSVRVLALDLPAVHDPNAARDRAAADPHKKVPGLDSAPLTLVLSVPGSGGLVRQ